MTDTTTPDFDPFNPSSWDDAGDDNTAANQSSEASHDAQFEGIIGGAMEDALEDVIADVESEDAPTPYQTADDADEGSEEQEPEPEPEPEVPSKKLYKFKVNGEEVEREFDETELLARLSHAERAELALQEAAKNRKNIETLLNEVKKDPSVLFKHLNIDAVDWSERFLGSHLEDLSLSPEARAARDNEVLMRRYQAEQERIASENEATQIQQAKVAAEAKLNQDIQSAILNAPGLSQDPVVRTQTLLDVNRFLAADKAKAFRDGREPTLTPDQAVKRAMDARQREIKDLFKNMKDDNALYEFIGQETMKRLRRKDVEKAPKFPANRASSNVAPKKQEQVSPLGSMNDFDKWARNFKD